MYALRCFTRQDASSPERYAAFDSFVAGQGLGQHVGQVTWHDGAVRAKGATWPVLQMEWIEGQQLNEYVGYLAEGTNTDALGKLASRWLKLVDGLQRPSSRTATSSTATSSSTSRDGCASGRLRRV